MSLRENIIHESQKLFSLNGFLNTGINEIIQASGTSKGGFYNHFCSKEDLFLEVLAEAQIIWRAKVLTSINEIESPTRRWLDWKTEALVGLDATCGFVRLVMGVKGRGVEAGVIRFLKKIDLLLFVIAP